MYADRHTGSLAAQNPPSDLASGPLTSVFLTAPDIRGVSSRTRRGGPR
jgi:hypothetical protein